MVFDARRALEQALAGDCSCLRHPDADADAVLRLAQQHGVHALLWQALQDDAGGPAGARLVERVRADVARELLRGRELARVLEALATADVPALVVKGAALAYTAYAEPWLRPRVDTDVLVPAARLDAAAAALMRLGYARSDAVTSGTLVSHQAAFERRDENGLGHVVDLHWKIVNPQVLADALSFDQLWSDRRAASALGPAAFVPSPAASLVLGCIHRLAHHHGDERLVWLFDFRLLAEGFGLADWETFTALARAGGIAGLCLDGLRQARALLGAPLPQGVEAELALASPSEASRVFLQEAIGRRHVLASDLRALTDWRARLRLLTEHAFPPAAFIRQRYGAGNRWPLPALYLHRLVTGAYRWVRP